MKAAETTTTILESKEQIEDEATETQVIKGRLLSLKLRFCFFVHL